MQLKLQRKNNKIFAPLKNIWIKDTAEERLKQEFIIRLVNSYGYSLEQLDQDIEIKKRYKADIAIWRSKEDKEVNSVPSIIITVECKAEHIKIKESDYLLGYNFASTINANFFIAVNLKETKIFHIKKNSNLQKLEKLSDIPKAEIIDDNLKIEKYIKDTKTFTREEFSKLLTRCHNIIRNNDKLSPEASFDEISKVLFMKIMYERSSSEGMIFSKEKFQEDDKNYELVIRPQLKKEAAFLDQDYMQYLFENTKRAFLNDGIFDLKDQIKIKKASFEMIVEELQAFNLSDTSDDIKGIAFEQFLGKTFRGELGQFFTPRTIVDYMVEILDPKENELICDPCCGSGGFLITAFEYVRDQIDEDIQRKTKDIKEKYYGADFEKLSISEQKDIEAKVNSIIHNLNKEFDIKNDQSRYYHLSHDCIFGTDANPRMARTAKMNMIMHGDGHGGVHHHDGLLNVNGIFENRFDVILTNPPFGARVEESLKITEQDRFEDTDKINFYSNKYGDKYRQALKQVNDNIDKPILSLYEMGKISTLTEVLFLERCLNLLKPGGRMGIVLPEGIMNNAALQKVRSYVGTRAKIINITSIPQDVFVASGATIKPSILFLQKFTKEEIAENKQNYELILANIEDAGITSTGAYSLNNQFPKASQEFKSYINQEKTSFDLIGVYKYSDLINWSVSHNIVSNFKTKESPYKSVQLKEFLKKNTNVIKVDDKIEYRRITIRINNNGIVLRDVIAGNKIGTKRQYVVKEGQLAISKIDARNGAIGLIPKELDGAIVTPDFLTYNINNQVISPEYLELIVSTKTFIEFCRKFSSGSTNRQRLNESLFLNAKIPLPPYDIQLQLIKKISSLKKIITDAEANLLEARNDFETNIF
uniref:N-6 DNA methylase n=1 Tax=uncultured Dysgonomonas sp. TaxID=206096 RepID=UPI002582B538|nr:N-6 DNA methylase [uncultured Dysgonomonas sp.]